eukprot:2373749-Pyramimonas_sp.AAC.1
MQRPELTGAVAGDKAASAASDMFISFRGALLRALIHRPGLANGARSNLATCAGTHKPPDAKSSCRRAQTSAISNEHNRSTHDSERKSGPSQ